MDADSRSVIVVLVAASTVALAVLLVDDAFKMTSRRADQLPTPAPVGERLVAAPKLTDAYPAAPPDVARAPRPEPTAPTPDAAGEQNAPEFDEAWLGFDFCPYCPGTAVMLADFLVGSDGARADYFGGAVDVDGDTMVIGAPQAAETGPGKAYVFERDPARPLDWRQVAVLAPSDGAPGDAFGRDVAIDGDTLAIGSRYSMVRGHAHQGRVHIYARDSQVQGGWRPTAVIDSGEAGPGDEFGMGLALQGDMLVVSAPRGDVDGSADQGKAYVFVRYPESGDQWAMTQVLVASDGAPGDIFGRTVTMDGDTLVVGAWGADVSGEADQGKAYVFEREDDGMPQWRETQVLTGSGGAAGDRFGRIVAMDGDTLVLSAGQGQTNGTGKAYIFERDYQSSRQWIERKVLGASDGAAGDTFGISVAIGGDTVAVGASAADVYGKENQGKTYVFERNEGGPGNWGELEVVTTPDGYALDLFGWDVAIDENTLVATANFANVGADENRGKAYVYHLLRKADLQHAYEQELIASATEVAVQHASGSSDSLGSAPFEAERPLDWRPGTEQGVATGSKVFLADARAGLRIVDASDPAHPVLLATFGSSAEVAAVEDGKAYVASGNRLEIVDVSDPSSPVMLASVGGLDGYSLPGFPMPNALVVSGGYAYVGCGDASVWIVEVRDPTAPTIVGQLMVPDVHDLAVTGTTLFVGHTYGQGFRAYDVADPLSPQWIAVLDLNHGFEAMAKDGDYVYGAMSAGIGVLDVTNPARPAFVANISQGIFESSRYTGVVVKDGVLLATGRDNRLHVYDVSVPTAPRFLGVHEIVPDFALDLIPGEGNIVYVVYGHGGLQVLDVSDPTAPREVGRLEGPG